MEMCLSQWPIPKQLLVELKAVCANTDILFLTCFLSILWSQTFNIDILLFPQALYRARLLNNINLETMKAKILLEARDELQATFQMNEAKRNMKTFDIK